MDRCPAFFSPLKEECGLFAIRAPGEKVSQLTFFGLHSLQHRGQESAGIVVRRENKLHLHRDLGLVDQVFKGDILENLQGDMALGHVRYSTVDSITVADAQPLLINSARGQLAVGHNGHLVNKDDLRRDLEREGSIFHSSLDTEVLLHLIARSRKEGLVEAILDSLTVLKGGYAFIIMTPEKIIGIRDPLGIRPLVLGSYKGHPLLASETCAFNVIEGSRVRDVNPGEMVILEEDSIQTTRFARAKARAFCIFETIYFARPDSSFDGQNVHMARKRMGAQLAREMDVEGDMVIPVPDSGISAAQGFAEERKMSYQHGLLKNRYVGRTFIQPFQDMRDLKVRLKLSPIRDVVKGKEIILTDDSIVRGTTSSKIVGMIREAGARKVHFAVSSPPIMYPCCYGVDTSTRQELVAARRKIQEIEAYIGADSLSYLSLEGLLSAVANGEGYCTACLNGYYPHREIPWEFD